MFTLLVRRGKFTELELLEEWEKIIEANSELTGQMEYSTYKELLIQYGQLLVEYNIDKGMLMNLLFNIDDEMIMELQNKGYIIDTSGRAAYAQSLSNALTRSNNLVTRIEMKVKELERFNNSSKMDQPVTYEQLIAQCSAALGFSVPDNITLAAFNEYQRILKRRNNRHSSQKPIE